MSREPTEYESVAAAFVAAIRAVSAVASGAVVLRLNKGEAEGVVASFERLMRERDELREASRALLTDLEAPMGDLPIWCNYPRCRRLAMCNDGDQYACDEHQGMLVTPDVEDCSYAAPLRKLRALVEGP